MSSSELKKPWGLRWRSSVWFVTAVVGLGVMTDLLVYSIVIPVLPFQLEHLGYTSVSGLVGWLLFGYSGGLVLSTPPIALFSEKYNTRTWPLISGQIFLIGSQIMLMEAPTYWLMVLARIIQGISSSIIWVVGLALLCDTAAESIIGRQLGIAMTGISVGGLVGPVVGGVLYNRFGFRGPGICAIIITAVDLIGRLLIIERKDALKYGVDPAAEPATEPEATVELAENMETNKRDNDGALAPQQPGGTIDKPRPPPLSLLAVIKTLAKSPRALTVMFCTAIYGVVYAGIEPALPLHLQAVWNFNSSKVGLVYLAGVLPTFLTSPLAGWFTDKIGPEWIILGSTVLSLPWFGLLAVQSSLAFFIAMFCLANGIMTAVVPPLTTEFGSVSRQHEGMGYAHVYGAFNLSFGIGSALGPIIGGQMYDHIRRGWLAICFLAIGLLALCACLAALFAGERPLLFRPARRARAAQPAPESSQPHAA